MYLLRHFSWGDKHIFKSSISYMIHLLLVRCENTNTSAKHTQKVCLCLARGTLLLVIWIEILGFQWLWENVFICRILKNLLDFPCDLLGFVIKYGFVITVGCRAGGALRKAGGCWCHVSRVHVNLRNVVWVAFVMLYQRDLMSESTFTCELCLDYAA